MSRRALRLEAVKMFVLDEADEMLSRGFKEQIYDVFKYMPETVQCCIFSATMPLEVRRQMDTAVVLELIGLLRPLLPFSLCAGARGDLQVHA